MAVLLQEQWSARVLLEEAAMQPISCNAFPVQAQAERPLVLGYAVTICFSSNTPQCSQLSPCHTIPSTSASAPHTNPFSTSSLIRSFFHAYSLDRSSYSTSATLPSLP